MQIEHPLGTKTVKQSFTEVTHLIMHEDINGAERLFGGRLMEWIDECAGIAAIRHCGCNVTTACVDSLRFLKGAYLGEVMVIQARVTFVGKSSVEVRVDSFVEDPSSCERTLVNRAYIIEVCIDDEGKPTVAPYDINPQSHEELIEWEDAQRRKEIRRRRAAGGF